MVTQRLTDIAEEPTELIMEAVSSSEIMTDIFQTMWCHIQEDSNVHVMCTSVKLFPFISCFMHHFLSAIWLR